jgi:NAD+ synthase
VERTGLHRVVVGLSGGIDSALAAYLAVRALGPSGVVGVLMPYRTSSPSSVKDAEAVVGALGIVAERFEISELVDVFAAKAGAIGPRRLGNVMARVRMLVLYDRSVEHDALVLGTSNKTELLLGYGTIHGDLASALNPLGDLYKTQVRELSRALSVPKSILDKPPSADLWPEQTDEADLGVTYDEVDRILALLVDARVSPGTIVAKGFKREIVLRVQRLIMRSQFKRRMPLIAKVSTRSIGWDFRYARDWKT